MTAIPAAHEPHCRRDEKSTSVWFLCGRVGPANVIQCIPIEASPFRVGRRQDAALYLPSRTVSSTHAELRIERDDLWLADQGSTNGTFVNADRVYEPLQLHCDDLVQFGDAAFRILRQVVNDRMATESHSVLDQALALVQFDRLISEQAVVPHYQPVVNLSDEEVLGFEVLGRSKVAGLESAVTMFAAAEQLNMEVQLSEMFRWKSVEETLRFPHPPHLFLNTHPSELQHQEALIESIRSIRTINRRQQITLEIHESAVAGPEELRHLRECLRQLDVSLAFDDFGAGQARLAEMAQVQPEYIKFDISLIRCIDRAEKAHREMVKTLVGMVRNLDIVPLAEGIETPAEADECRRLGFELAQGFLFGKPSPIAWPS